jgi:hypothetical protein
MPQAHTRLLFAVYFCNVSNMFLIWKPSRLSMFLPLASVVLPLEASRRPQRGSPNRLSLRWVEAFIYDSWGHELRLC